MPGRKRTFSQPSKAETVRTFGEGRTPGCRWSEESSWPRAAPAGRAVCARLPVPTGDRTPAVRERDRAAPLAGLSLQRLLQTRRYSGEMQKSRGRSKGEGRRGSQGPAGCLCSLRSARTPDAQLSDSQHSPLASPGDEERPTPAGRLGARRARMARQRVARLLPR